MVNARYVYEKGLVACEDDSRRYSFGISESVDTSLSKKIVKRVKAIQEMQKKAITAENYDNKRYYEAVNINIDKVEPTYKRKGIFGLFAKKYTREEISAVRDELIHALNERDALNGKLISIYEGQMVDLGGQPITLEIREVKSKAAELMYKSARMQRRAKSVDKLATRYHDKQSLYQYLNEEIDTTANIAVIEYRLKQAKKDNLTAYEISQLRKDRAAQEEARKAAIRKFNRTFEKEDAKIKRRAWEDAFVAMLVLLIAAIVAFAWFFGPEFLDNLKNLFGI
jgi:hypothetical protein